MRTRQVIAIIALVALGTLFALRHHLRDLHGVFITYSTFHGLIQQHSELVYRYPWPMESPPVVPKILHQIALGPVANLTKYSSAVNSCRALHPDWQYHLWTSANSTAFIHAHYPTLLPHYTSYAQEIQRANILRYALLHHHGGVYLDLDITCLAPLHATPLLSLPLVSPAAHPAGVNNAFIAAAPGHPFLGALLRRVPARDLAWRLLPLPLPGLRLPYVENMLSTGCMFFSNAWMAYVRGRLGQGLPPGVFVLGDARGGIERMMLRGKVTTELFAHGGASSWHGWDGRIMVGIGEHYGVLAAAVGCVGVGVLLGVVRMCMRTRGARLRRRLLSPSPQRRERGRKEGECEEEHVVVV